MYCCGLGAVEGVELDAGSSDLEASTRRSSLDHLAVGRCGTRRRGRRCSSTRCDAPLVPHQRRAARARPRPRAHRMNSTRVDRGTPARRRGAARAASGIHSMQGEAQMAAPYSDTARSKLASRGGRRRRPGPREDAGPISRPRAWRGGQLGRRRVEADDAAGPRPASATPRRSAVPQPISTTSLPATSGSAPTSASGISNWPQVIVVRATTPGGRRLA